MFLQLSFLRSKFSSLSNRCYLFSPSKQWDNFYTKFKCQKYSSPSSFERKQAFISLLSLAWGKSLMLCKLCAGAHVDKLMTQTLCAVGMHNTILRIEILPERESFNSSLLFCLGSFEGHYKRSLRISLWL